MVAAMPWLLVKLKLPLKVTVVPALRVRPTVQAWSMARLTTISRRSISAAERPDRSSSRFSSSSG